MSTTQRPIVLYRDARGKECICEAEEYDVVWADYPGVTLIERGLGTFVCEEWTDPLKGDYQGRVWPDSLIFSRKVRIPLLSSTVVIKALPNMSSIVGAYPIENGELTLWFHCSRSREGTHRFDKRYHFVRGGLFGQEAVGHVLDFTRPHTFECEGLTWFIFPHVESAKPSVA